MLLVGPGLGILGHCFTDSSHPMDTISPFYRYNTEGSPRFNNSPEVMQLPGDKAGIQNQSNLSQGSQPYDLGFLTEAGGPQSPVSPLLLICCKESASTDKLKSGRSGKGARGTLTPERGSFHQVSLCFRAATPPAAPWVCQTPMHLMF